MRLCEFMLYVAGCMHALLHRLQRQIELQLCLTEELNHALNCCAHLQMYASDISQ